MDRITVLRANAIKANWIPAKDGKLKEFMLNEAKNLLGQA